MPPVPPVAPSPAAPFVVPSAVRQIAVITLLLSLLTVIGVLGLRVTTGAGWFDCLYMAVITLTTVGYAETVPLGTAGRVFVICYLGAGIGVFTFSAFQLGALLLNPGMQVFLRRRRMQHAVDRLDGHFIVCGLGRMGTIIAEYLHQRGRAFVVVDRDTGRVASECEPRGWLAVVGDATDDRTLLSAGVARAKSLAAVLPTDSDNVYVVLSAHMLAPKVQIIARAGDSKAVEKLRRAGASRVVSPFTSGAVKMARFMISPTMEDFLEIADARGHDLELADIQITAENPYVGKTLAETDLREKGVMVVGIRRASGERLMPPPDDARILAGDSLFAFGPAAAVNRHVARDAGGR